MAAEHVGVQFRQYPYSTAWEARRWVRGFLVESKEEKQVKGAVEGSEQNSQFGGSAEEGRPAIGGATQVSRCVCIG